MTLISCSLAVYQQLHYVRTKDLGYAKDSVVEVRVFGREAGVLKARLSGNPRILDVTLSSQWPTTVTGATAAHWEGQTEGSREICYFLVVDDPFLDFYRIPVLVGRALSRTSSPMKDFLLNEAAVKAFGWKDAVGKRFGSSPSRR
jgi:putative ABC transport system permease protein